MPRVGLAGPRLSAIQMNGIFALDATNGGCHGNTSGVEQNDKAIIAHARLMIVCWGSFYASHPDALTFAEALCKDLVTGPFLNGLAQYGIGRGSIAGLGRVEDNPPATLSEDDVRSTVLGWMTSFLNSAAPAINETSLVYVVFLPPETKPTIASGNDDFCGYHYWTKFNDASANSDVFYAIIRTDKADQSSGASLIKSTSACVSHEIAEMLTSRDGRGYHEGSCEIGDLCEQTGTHDYRKWKVEQYWSQWDNSCINGENAISVRRFLKARGVVGGSLRALHTQVLNVEYIASQFR